MKYYIDFSKTLRGLMKKRQISETQLSELSGVQRNLIVRYLSGEVEPMLNNAFRLSKGLGCKLDELYPRPQKI